MNKYFIFLSIAFSLLVSLGLISSAKTGQNQSAFSGATATPTPSAKIEKIELDRTEVFISCPPGKQLMPGAVCDDNSSIKVKSSAVNPQNAELLYHYTISGGRIIGKGDGVTWDLSGVRVGTYTISVCISAGSEFCPETQTKSVRVKECVCGFVDACPTLEISTPSDSFKAGETITFTANVSGKSDNLTYNWTVSAGTIIEGQGTPKIKVETTREMADGSLTARVEISSDRVASICETEASKTVSMTK
jgi:hypothetical protein